MVVVKPTTDSEVTENTQNTETQENVSPDLNTILARLDKLESENQALREWKKVDEKAKYEWPRHYSFKIFDNKPVLWYKSFKKDNTRDWKYKALNGQEIINQWLKLTLWDFEKNKEVVVEVWVDNFHEWFWRSEYMEAEVIWNWTDIKWYNFTTTSFWKFTVLPNSIN